MRASEEHGIGELPGRAPRPDELRKPAPGDMRMLVVSKRLDGPIHEVGERFWRFVASDAPGLEARLDGPTPLAAVTYSDRYVRSPLVERILSSVTSALAGRSGGLAEDTRIVVQTERARGEAGARWLDHDWEEAGTQRAVLESLFRPFGRLELEIHQTGPRLQHGRRLTLEWKDGARLEMELEHGLGFLRTTGVRHEFRARPEAQAEALRRLRAAIACVGGETRVYVSGIMRS